MDNKLLNINGESKELLLMALELAFAQEGDNAAKSWKYDSQKGLILSWFADATGFNKFPAPLTAKQVVDIVWNWLQSDEAKTVPFGQWENDYQHDGDNSLGWRVYVDDWGHVGGEFSTICAIKLAYLWYGK